MHAIAIHAFINDNLFGCLSLITVNCLFCITIAAVLNRFMNILSSAQIKEIYRSSPPEKSELSNDRGPKNLGSEVVTEISPSALVPSRGDLQELQELLSDILTTELNSEDIEHRLDLICPENNQMRNQLTSLFNMLTKQKNQLLPQEGNETFDFPTPFTMEQMINADREDDINSKINMGEIEARTQQVGEQMGIDPELTSDITVRFVNYLSGKVSSKELTTYLNQKSGLKQNPALDTLIHNFDILKAESNRN